MSTIIIPGQGATDLGIRRVNGFVNEYDERLFAARHPETGYHTIFIKMPAHTEDNEEWGISIEGQRAYPVLAFPEGFPHRDDIMGRLYRMDARRRGSEMLDEINRQNEAVKDEKRWAAADAAAQLAEVVESYKHDQGQLGYHRSLRPTLKTGVRR